MKVISWYWNKTIRWKVWEQSLHTGKVPSHRIPIQQEVYKVPFQWSSWWSESKLICQLTRGRIKGIASPTKSDYILCSQRQRSSIQSAKTRPGADCGSDHELLIAKFRLKLKKVGITTRLFRYDLNQIPYDYTVEVRNRFRGLDLIECLKNYGWGFVTLCRKQWSRPSPRKRTAKRQNGCLRRPYT